MVNLSSAKKAWSELIHPHYCCVTITTEKDTTRFSAVVLKKVKDELTLVVKKDTLDSADFNNWCEKLKIEDLVVSVQGTKVLGKTVVNTQNVFDAFPGLNMDEFYYVEEFDSNSNQRLNIIRKSDFEEVVQSSIPQSALIRNIELGDSTDSTLHKMMQLNAIKKKGDDYIFNHSILSAQHAIALSACLKLITGQSSKNNFHLFERFEKNTEDALFKNRFNKFAAPLAICLFAIAVVSKGVLVYHLNLLEDQEMNFAFNEAEQVSIGELSEQLKHLNQLGNISGNNLNATFAEMSYRISEITPKKIEFQHLQIRPLNKPGNNGFELDEVYDYKSIYIVGSSPQVEELNLFIEKLKNLNFIDQVRLIDITRDEKREVSNFNLKIQIN